LAVMGFCTAEQRNKFLVGCQIFERDFISNDLKLIKYRGRLNCIAHFLSQIPYEVIESEPVELPPRSKENEYDDRAPMLRRKYIPERY